MKLVHNDGVFSLTDLSAEDVVLLGVMASTGEDVDVFSAAANECDECDGMAPSAMVDGETVIAVFGDVHIHAG